MEESTPSPTETPSTSIIRRDKPPGYVTPPFPSLHWPPQHDTYSLYDLGDMWRFTLLWTLIIYGLVHLGAVGIALMMQVGKKKSNWKFLWLVPLLYAAVAGAEALLAGSLVGLVVGATYKAGAFTMSTWIPFIWGWVNVLILILSSFRIQGGL